ncbi:transglycosylase domain-containing protein [Tropicibacter naphthalenivorans]|uniref:peptidoglycan glycosyltransferase n=1 Tax=Tropicibacter naphthalenivorans TaxID=441103 RepID=A0A0N7LZR6_9RHOB|nr:transglycosylase domain-containing protein [Tropicibacter naphthalenivorans]CUH78409.1 Penicillin-binding protein 2D [Tropicibacter naphthalenivorans]SMC80234.1 Membrane carboxypeptidase (penicillin-binding protein) [Tropicibacter naphthalenivorans]
MSSSGKKPSRLVADRRYPRKSESAPKKKAPARRAPKRKAPRGPIRKVLTVLLWPFLMLWRLVWRVVVFASIVTALLIGGAVWYTSTGLPEISDMVDGRARGSVTLLDREGRVFALRGDQFGGAVTADSVSEHLKNAIVATEDKRFYSHFGLSPRGIASAIRINMSEGRGPLSGHGGSTITQQTAKLLCLGVVYDPTKWESEVDYVEDCRRGSLKRKATEAIYAMAMEWKYTKSDILSIYMNRAYMGGGAYGAAAAAERYFSKPAAALNPAESAMLAGLLTAPSSLAPTANLKRSQDRAATVLRLMNEQGYLSDADTAYWQANPATLAESSKNLAGGYFADWMMRTGPEFFTRDTTEDVIISTTLDPRIQKAAADAVNKVFSEKVREGSKAQVAVVVMSADGAVRAMIGGRDTDASGVFNRAFQAIRQTGSAFKPFVYATALELGYSPLDTIVDEPFCMNIPGSGQWCPENYSHKNYGRVTLTEALKNSLNIPAVKISESVGRDLVMRVARDFGIYRDLKDTPSLALGVSEANLLEMTGAYAGILNGGSSVTPYGLRELRLKGESEALMGTPGGMGERVIRQEAAGQLIWMMEKVVSEGTGGRARLPDRQVAGKTGTSQEARDAWFVGFSADYVAGVWMGYDDNTPLTGVTGSGLPAEIWHEVMVRVHDGLPVRPLPMVQPAPIQVAEPEPTPAPVPQRRVQESVLEQVLRDIFGGN